MKDKTFDATLAVIEMAADFYHSMDLDDDEPRYYWQFFTALEILERIQGFEIGTLTNSHFSTCLDCKDKGY